MRHGRSDRFSELVGRYRQDPESVYLTARPKRAGMMQNAARGAVSAILLSHLSSCLLLCKALSTELQPLNDDYGCNEFGGAEPGLIEPTGLKC